jgi:NADPH-dependent curcumin reductase CurA
MSTNEMRSLRFAEFGPPLVLRLEEVPIPEPSDGEALVRVKAAGINPGDIGNVAGHFKKTTLPRTPGRDFAGIAVKGKHEGREVWGSSPTLGIVHDGSHAEYVVVPVETLSLKPKALSTAQAAAIGVPYITAWACLVNAAQIQAGETILIVGAAGAMGQAAERETPIPAKLATSLKGWKAKADKTCDLVFPTTGCKVKMNFLDDLKAVAQRAEQNPESFGFTNSGLRSRLGASGRGLIFVPSSSGLDTRTWRARCAT